MSEKVTEHGQIVDKDDAHGLAILENEAFDAERNAEAVSADVAMLEEPSSEALRYEDGEYAKAEQARKLANTALTDYLGKE